MNETLNLYRFYNTTLEPVKNSRSTGALNGRGVLNSKKTFNTVGYNNNTDNYFNWHFKYNSNSSIIELII